MPAGSTSSTLHVWQFHGCAASAGSAMPTCAVRVCQLLPVASVHLGRAGRALWSEKGWTMAIAKRARLKDAWRL